MEYNVDENGYYGTFGGAYIPEILYANVETLRNNYLNIISEEGFQKELDTLMRDYVGRPSPLYYARRLSEKYGAKIYLKREDLNHTGAHKINNTLGQILLARRMGKTRIIAETGAGQHGVATATVCALMNMQCIVYMGETDIRRQHLNVQKMQMLGRSPAATKRSRTRRTRLSATGAATRLTPTTSSARRSARIPTPIWWPGCNRLSAVKSNNNCFRNRDATTRTTSSPASGEVAMPPGRFTNTSGTTA